MPNKIANKAEWAFAKEILENERQKGSLFSGYKIDLKKHKKLKHSFVYFSNQEGKEKLVCLSRYYFLGKGAGGKVKLVEDENDNLFAIKMCRTIRAKVRGKKTSEKEILDRLENLYFYGINDKQEYFLQEFYPGLTLDSYCSLCDLNDEQKWAFIYHLAKTIQHLHQNNIIHGDIKSNNFIINVTADQIATIKAVDFDHSDLILDEQDIKKEISREVRSFGELIKTQLSCENRFIIDIINGKYSSIDEFIGELEKFSSIKLPVPNSKKQLLEEYRVLLKINKQQGVNDYINKFLRYKVKTTNDISQLNELFKFVKEIEKVSPLLLRDRKTNVVGMTDVWKETIDIFKTRAMQIANDNVNLENPIVNPEQYYNILAENNVKRFVSPGSRLYKFEKLLSSKKTITNIDKETYQRAKLIKYFESYIDRIDRYKHKDNSINFNQSFWFNPEERGIHRKANYQVACAFRDELYDSNRSLADIFNDENIQKIGGSTQIYSMELRYAINRGKTLAKKTHTIKHAQKYQFSISG